MEMQTGKGARKGKILAEIHPKLSALEGIDTFSESDGAKARGETVEVPKVSTAEFRATATGADGVVTTREALAGRMEPVPADAAADKRIREALAENLKELRADAQGLEKVLSFLRDAMAVNVFWIGTGSRAWGLTGIPG